MSKKTLNEQFPFLPDPEPRKLSCFSIFFIVLLIFFSFGFLLGNFTERFLPKRLYPVKQYDRLTSFQSNDYPLSFSYPSAWQLEEKSQALINNERCFVFIKGFDPSICFSYGRDMRYFNRGKDWAGFLINRYPNPTEPEVKGILINDTEWIQYDFQYHSKTFFNVFGRPRYCRLYLLGNDEEAYAINFCTHQINHERLLPLFEEIMKSVRIALHGND